MDENELRNMVAASIRDVLGETNGTASTGGWRTFMVLAGLVLLCALVTGLLWLAVFGFGAPEGATLWKSLTHVLVATVVAWAITAISLIVLEVALARFTVRDDFMALVARGEASDVAIALYSIGTSLYAGLIFLATLDALSIG